MPTWDEISPYLERDTSARRWNAVNALIAANVVGLVIPALAAFLKLDFLVGILTFHYRLGIEKLWIWQFLTYTFWHPITGPASNDVTIIWSVLGLTFGCYILHQMARDLEHEWGWKRFTVFYLACGVYGAVAHAAYQILGQSDFPAFDFFGPVLACLLVWAMKGPNRRLHFLFFFEMRAMTAAWLTIGLVVLFCLAGWHYGITPIATLGAVASAWIIHKLEPRLDAYLDAREQRVARERFLDEFEVKRQVDQILDKINKQGMDSLTSHERKLLRRASRMFSAGPGAHHD